MASKTVLPDAIVQPFPSRTPFLAPEQTGQGNQVSWPHTKFLQNVANGVNSSAQLSPTVPTSSTSKGNPGQIAYDSGNLYVCVSSNTWLKFVGAPF